MRAIEPATRVMMTVNSDRKRVLQNGHIEDGAGDVVDTLLGLVMGNHPSGPPPILLTLTLVLLSPLKRLCSR